MALIVPFDAEGGCAMSYNVRDFDPESLEDAAKLADLFNSFDSIWPGGFTHGVPDTAVSVQDRHRRMRRMAVCIVEHESGEFAGYCTLNSEVGITDRAYLPLLGASAWARCCCWR
jgi:hypothetical protein